LNELSIPLQEEGSGMWKVVIIDDDRQVLQGMKASIPWETIGAVWAGEAMDGEQGLDIIEAAQPDIVLTDIYMPVMNGLDMIEELQRRNFQGKIIILSGYNDFEYARKALRMNVEDYLSKPVTLLTLRNVFETAIQQLEEQTMEKLEQEQLRQKLRLYEPFVAKEMINALVAGTFRDSDLQQYLHHHHDLMNHNHVVLAIEIIRTDRVLDISTSDWNLFRFAVNNIIREVILEGDTKSSLVELHSHHAAVLVQFPYESPVDKMLEQTRKLGKRIIQCTAKYLSIQLHIGVGHVKDRWERISDSTEEAFQALSLKRFAPCPDFDLYEYAIDQKEGEWDLSTSIRPIKFYQQLAEAIQHTQEERSLQMIRAFLVQLKESEQTKPSFLQRLGMEIWTIFTYSLYNTGVVLDEQFPPQDIHAELKNISKINQLEEWLEQKVTEICRNRSWNENVKHKHAVEFMVEYIHDHYSEDITLSDLAEKVYISRNYLSHIFRSSTGDTFNQYVTKVRMEKAKRLILEGKYLIYEIAEKVGYKNVPYFSTLYKKHTGCNPSDLLKSPEQSTMQP
jgi:two-component system response regulator YesN